MATERREAKKIRERQAAAARRAAERQRYRRKALALLAVFALLLVALGGAIATTSGGSDDSASSTTSTSAAPATTTIPPVPAGRSITGETPCPAADGSTERASTFEKAPPVCIDTKKSYKATFDTTEGKVVVALDTQKTPGTTNNFVVLSRYHYYVGSAIVRSNTTIDIIQGGAPSTQTNADPGPGYTINDEGTPFTYKEGDLVMANAGPNSSGAQWFFGAGPKVSNLDPSPTSPTGGSYLNFGKTVEGLDVLQKILALHQDGSEPGDGAPSKPVMIKTVTISES